MADDNRKSPWIVYLPRSRVTHLVTAEIYPRDSSDALWIYTTTTGNKRQTADFFSLGAPRVSGNAPFWLKKYSLLLWGPLFQINLAVLSSCQQVVLYTNHLMHLLAAPLLIRGYRYSSALLVFLKDTTRPRGAERSCHESTPLRGFMFTGNSSQSLHLCLIEILHAQSQHCEKRKKTKLPIKTKPNVSFFFLHSLCSHHLLLFLSSWQHSSVTNTHSAGQKKGKEGCPLNPHTLCWCVSLWAVVGSRHSPTGERLSLHCNGDLINSFLKMLILVFFLQQLRYIIVITVLLCCHCDVKNAVFCDIIWICSQVAETCDFNR